MFRSFAWEEKVINNRTDRCVLSPRGGLRMQAKIVTICSTVAELGVFFAAALALVLGLTSLR